MPPEPQEDNVPEPVADLGTMPASEATEPEEKEVE